MTEAVRPAEQGAVQRVAHWGAISPSFNGSSFCRRIGPFPVSCRGQDRRAISIPIDRRITQIDGSVTLPAEAERKNSARPGTL
jgi:hypothetical protein